MMLALTPENPRNKSGTKKSGPSPTALFFSRLKAQTFPLTSRIAETFSPKRPNFSECSATASASIRKQKLPSEEADGDLLVARPEAARKRVEMLRRFLKAGGEEEGEGGGMFDADSLQTSEQKGRETSKSEGTGKLSDRRHDSSISLPLDVVTPPAPAPAVPASQDDIDILRLTLTPLTKLPPHNFSVAYHLRLPHTQDTPTCQLCAQPFLSTDQDNWKITGCRAHFLHGECLAKVEGAAKFPIMECGRCEGVAGLVWGRKAVVREKLG